MSSKTSFIFATCLFFGCKRKGEDGAKIMGEDRCAWAKITGEVVQARLCRRSLRMRKSYGRSSGYAGENHVGEDHANEDIRAKIMQAGEDRAGERRRVAIREGVQSRWKMEW